jgi:hypothetical protein
MAKRVSRVVACLALAALSGCGGGSNPTGPTPTPVPTPRPTPVTTTVRQGTFTGLEPNMFLGVPLTVNFSGEVQAIVDWTFETNDLDIAISPGTFTCFNAAGLFDPSLCQFVAISAGVAKPERISAQLAAGQYTLYVENAGSSSESLSFQVLLTYTPTSGGPGASLAARPDAALTSLLVGRGAPRALRRASPR